MADLNEVCRLILSGHTDGYVADKTGWTVEAVQTFRIELECAETGDC